MSISTAQMRGARGLLNWGQNDLSDRTGISTTSIGSIENGITIPRESSIAAITKAFEDAGIEFTGNDGVRMRSADIRIFSGRSGFSEFYEDIFRTLQSRPGQVSVSNVDERLFEKWHGQEKVKEHVDRMKGISGISYRILIKEGDEYYTSGNEYTEYRWLPKDMFSSVPFYVFGEKLAIILFDKEPTVILLNYPLVADAYRLHFDSLWANCSAPKMKSA